MPDPTRPTPEQQPPQPLTDPVVPPLRDPPAGPYRDPVPPQPSDPQHKPLRDPDPPPDKDPPGARRGALLRRRHHSRTVRNRSAFPTTLTDDSAIAAAPMIGESRMPKNG